MEIGHTYIFWELLVTQLVKLAFSDHITITGKNRTVEKVTGHMHGCASACPSLFLNVHL